MYRKDHANFNSQLINAKSKNDHWFDIWVEANIEKPHHYILWAMSEKDGWAERIQNNL